MFGWCRLQTIPVSFLILLKANLTPRDRREYFSGLFQPYTPYTPAAITCLLFELVPPSLVQKTLVHEPRLELCQFIAHLAPLFCMAFCCLSLGFCTPTVRFARLNDPGYPVLGPMDAPPYKWWVSDQTSMPSKLQTYLIWTVTRMFLSAMTPRKYHFNL